MENQKKAGIAAKKQNEKKIKWVLAGICSLLALSVIAGILWGQFYIPLGCVFVVGGILLLSMRMTFDNVAMTFFAYAAFIVMLIVGAVLLYKGLTAGINRQDDLQYTQSLGVSAEELLATTNSEGTQYAVVKDGVISRRLLPENYQALRAEDIGAVLIVSTSHSKVGSYSGGGTAYRTDMKISLKSLKTGEIISNTTLSGDDPPKSIRVSPLDPNRDRYGNPPSDERIKNACVSLIERAKEEEVRKSQVTLFSEEELLELFRQIITQTAGEDGWSSMNKVESAIKEVEPNFSITDYGYKSLYLYFKNDLHYTVKERDMSDFISYMSSPDYVRWAGE